MSVFIIVLNDLVGGGDHDGSSPSRERIFKQSSDLRLTERHSFLFLVGVFLIPPQCLKTATEGHEGGVDLHSLFQAGSCVLRLLGTFGTSEIHNREFRQDLFLIGTAVALQLDCEYRVTSTRHVVRVGFRYGSVSLTLLQHRECVIRRGEFNLMETCHESVSFVVLLELEFSERSGLGLLGGGTLSYVSEEVADLFVVDLEVGGPHLILLGSIHLGVLSDALEHSLNHLWDKARVRPVTLDRIRLA